MSGTDASTDDTTAPGPGDSAATKSFDWKVAAKWLLIAVAVAFLGKAVHDQWPEVSAAIGEVPVWALASAVLAAATAVTISGEQQRSLLAALGHRVQPAPWFRVFFLAQLGKYVPGTAWAYVAQMELARRKGIQRVTSVIAILLGAGLTVLLAFVLGALVHDSLDAVPTWVQWLVVGASALGLVVLVARPSIVPAVLRRAPGRLRDLGLANARLDSLVRPTVWSALAWVAYGVHLWVLTVPMGLPALAGFPTAVGAFALAWVVGFLVVFVPAGVGVREAVLVAVLAPFITAPGALAAAVLSRFLIIVAEACLLALAPLLRRDERAAA